MASEVRAWDMAEHAGNALRRLGESESYISAFVEELAREHFAEVDAAKAEAWDEGEKAGEHYGEWIDASGCPKSPEPVNPYRRTP